MSANKEQVGGTHYKTPYEHWDFVVDHNISYLEAQVIRYVGRAHKKGGEEDIKKAAHFVRKIRERYRDHGYRRTFEVKEGVFLAYATLNELDAPQRFACWNILSWSDFSGLSAVESQLSILGGSTRAARLAHEEANEY